MFSWTLNDKFSLNIFVYMNRESAVAICTIAVVCAVIKVTENYFSNKKANNKKK